MKRYNFYYTNDFGDDYPAFKVEEEGAEYVAYEDHVFVLESVRKESAQRIAELENMVKAWQW